MMESLIIKKKQPTLCKINYEHSHNMLSEFGKKEKIPITVGTYKKSIHSFKKFSIMANRIAESSRVYRIFGHFLPTLCSEKKTHMQTQVQCK